MNVDRKSLNTRGEVGALRHSLDVRSTIMLAALAAVTALLAVYELRALMLKGEFANPLADFWREKHQGAVGGENTTTLGGGDGHHRPCMHIGCTNDAIVGSMFCAVHNNGKGD